MKRKLSLVICCIMALVGLTACGSSMPYDDYDFKEYIKVGDYKGLKVAPYNISVTDDEVSARIENTLQESAQTKELDAGTAIKDGDTVNIDYVGKLNGKAFDGGSAEGYELKIGSNSFIDGFESGLIGKKVGDKVDLNLTFPADYPEKTLKGQAVVFTVTINTATREQTPKYNLDFVKNTTKYTTLKDYEAAVAKKIYNEKEQEAIDKQKTTIWSDLLEKTEVKKYPEKELKHYIDVNSKQIDELATQYGMSREEVLSNYKFGNEKEFAAVNEDGSKLRVKQEMVVSYIADKENLSYTEKEKDKMIKEFENMGYDDKTMESQTGRNMDEYVHIELLYQKVLDFMLENADITGAPQKEDK